MTQMLNTLRGLRDSFKDTLCYIVGMVQEVAYLSDPAALGDMYELLDSHVCWRDLDFLQRIAGPFPFFLQVAADLLFEERKRSPAPTALDYEDIERRFIKKAEGHFKYIWGNLSPEEQRVLKHISAQRVGDVTRESWERLEQECLVHQGHIFSSAFARFVARQRL